MFEKGDNPELDSSELLDKSGIEQYQSLLGSLQWAISLGRFDIATAVMSMSSFHAVPRRDHLQHLQCMCGYLARMKHGTIRVRTHEPDYSDLPAKEHEWASVYERLQSCSQKLHQTLWAGLLPSPTMWMLIFFMMH